MFVKVFQKILDSSIWEESAPTRVVWITMLVSMDSDGFCQFATVETLARRARLKPCFVRDAVTILEAPDDSSSTPGEGRRIERVAGGWMVINAKKYRDISSNRELTKARNKPSQHVATCNNTSQHVTNFPPSPLESTKPVTEVEVEVEVTTTKRKRKKFSFESFAEGTSEVVNCFLPIWPEKRRDGSEVNVSKAMFADRVSELLRDGFTVQQLIACGNSYLDEKPDWPACPQYFFGPGNGKSANFSSYMKMLIHQTSKQAGQ